jgi:hypothetical protein
MIQEFGTSRGQVSDQALICVLTSDRYHSCVPVGVCAVLHDLSQGGVSDGEYKQQH